MSDHRRLLLACTGAFLLALLARAALAARMTILQPDGCWYIWHAEDIARGD